MKRCIGLLVSTLFLAAPILIAQDHSDHVEVGAFADYFRFSQTSPERNFVGVGGRAAVNVHRDVQLEAEMAYDFKRNFTQEFSDGVRTQFFNTRFRTLHGFFGPKFQSGSGPFRVFVTGKVGFDNFSISNQNVLAGFKSVIGLDNGRTDFALYPGGGVEAFAGPIGVRLEAGDDIYFDHGAHNNLRVTVGPQFRF
jgi:hypothetical protein